MTKPEDLAAERIERGETPWPLRPGRVHEIIVSDDVQGELFAGRRTWIAFDPGGPSAGELWIGDLIVTRRQSGNDPLLFQLVLLDDFGARLGWVIAGLRPVRLIAGHEPKGSRFESLPAHLPSVAGVFADEDAV